MTSLNTENHSEPDEGETYEPIARVTTLEVFFDLVFVFTITQLTAVLAGDPTARGVVRVGLMFGLIMWIYGGYVWLANAVAPDRLVRRLLSLLGMAGFLLIALAIPSAFDGGGTIFGVGYLLVVVVHAVLYTRSANSSSVAGILRVAPFNLVAAVLILVTGVLGGGWEYGAWTIALVLVVSTPFLTPIRMFRIQPAHFVERSGLLLLIVLGESVVAIGVGAGHLRLDAELAGTAVLALAVSACLWWAYFTSDDVDAEHALSSYPIGQRARPALNAFFYAAGPMLLGVVAFAAAVKKVIGHPAEALTGFAAGALAIGVALFLLGGAMFRIFLRLRGVLGRVIGAAVVLLTVPIGRYGAAAAQLAAIGVILVVQIAVDTRRRRRVSDPCDVQL